MFSDSNTEDAEAGVLLPDLSDLLLNGSDFI